MKVIDKLWEKNLIKFCSFISKYHIIFQFHIYADIYEYGESKKERQRK